MIRFVTLLVISAFACAGCSRQDSLKGALRIERSFHQTVEYQFEQSDDVVWLRTTVKSGPEALDRGEEVSYERRKLNENEAELLRNAVENALKSDITDALPSGGRDGSMWSVKISAPGEMRTKIWSPSWNAGDRVTQSVFELGELLWKLSGMVEELY